MNAILKSRVWAAVWVLVVTCLVVVRKSAADEVEVPVSLQADLLTKVTEYDKNFAARAGDRVHVLIYEKSGHAAAIRFASAMQSALANKEAISGLPHDEEILSYSSAANVAAMCRGRRVSIVYFGPGFSDDDIDAIRAALEGVDVLSVAAVPHYVERGIVLGVDLISGRPKLLFHLTQAKKQNVMLRGEALKLMKVFE